MLKRMLSVVLVAVLLVCVLPLGALPTDAATTLYETVKANVPIWSSASSKSTNVYDIAKSGTVIGVTGYTYNSSGNKWYKLTNGYWVFSGNVKSHSHKYTGGICSSSGCGYQWPYSISSKSGTFVVTNGDGAKIWSRPYSNNSTLITRLGYGTAMTINGSTKNQEGNTWYRRTDGYWVFSGNVTQRFTVSYHANGGVGAPFSQTVLSGGALTLSTTKPTRSGYLFRGWSTSSSASSASYYGGSSYRFSSNVTLYAVWKKCSHSYVGGICSTCGTEYGLSISSHSGTYVVTAADGAKIWTRPYSNNSTNVRRAAKGTVLSVTHKVKNQEGNTWYKLSDGYWVFSGNVARRYTVSYSANGGSGAPSAQTVLDGKKLTLSSKKPTRVGYLFQGWATSSGSSTVSYKPSTAYSFTSNKSLYAVWKKCSHSYVGGICSKCHYEYGLSPTAHSGTYVVTKSDGAKLWPRPYSTGSHVRRAANGTVLSVTHKVKNQEGNTWYKLSDGTWIFSGNVTRRYAITYKANGGSGAPSAQTVLAGKKLTVTTKKPTRAGYLFQGWATSSGSSWVSYKAGSSYTFSSSRTLYAVWKKCTHSYVGGICSKCKTEYKLTLTKHAATYVVTKSDGAKIWPRPYSTGGAVRRAAKNTVLKTTHQVKNQEGNTWYKLSDGTWVFSGNVTRRYAITYKANGGSGAPSAQTVLHGKTLTLSSKKPTRTGYLFQGWGTSASTDKITYKAGGSYKLTATKTVYAVWKKCTPHTFNKAGYCTKCKAACTYTVKTYVKTQLFQTSAAYTTRTRPFSAAATASLKLAKGDRVRIKAYTTIDGTNWYQLTNGAWVSGSKGAVVNDDGKKQVTTTSAISQDTTKAMTYLKDNVGKVTVSARIPGLIKTVTRTKGGTITTCSAMVPQGFTMVGGYVMISAYCKCLREHHSVVYVLSSSTHSLLTTLILDDYCHVGGIAKQGDYLWVCDSGGGEYDSHLRAYSYAEIKEAVNNKMPHRVLTSKNICEVKTTPSYLCSANGYLYVGTHHKEKTTAKIHFYSVKGDTLSHKGSFTISGIPKLQGIAIRGNAMVVTSSLGRTNKDVSKLYVFKSDTGFTTSGATYKKPVKTFKFANMAEGCYIGATNTYVICESGAKEYRASWNTRPLDKYVGFSNKTLGIS